MVKRIKLIKIEKDEMRYYVLGDNLDNSYDSRLWDDPYIGETDVIAKVLAGD